MRLAITTLALAPLLVVQGWYVKRVTPRLPEAEGARQGVTGQGKPLRLLVVGDSAAAGVGAVHQREALVGQLTLELASQFEVSWQLMAKTGFTTADLLAHLAQQSSQYFDIAVVSLGVNDVTRRVATRHWLTQQQELVELLATKFGVQKVLLSGVPPMGQFKALPQPLRWYVGLYAKQFNQHLKKHFDSHVYGCVVSPNARFDVEFLAKDGFHPSPVAYQHWAKVVAQKILTQFD